MVVWVAFAMLMAAKPAIGADASSLGNGGAVLGGGQLGATYRAGNFALGAEWMFGGTSLNASRIVGFPQDAANTSWDTTIAARFPDHTKLVAAPTPVTPVEQVQSLPSTPIPANELPTASYGLLSDPSATTEQSTAPNTLASLDRADRAIAEKIQELLATNS
jgi:hypothetical protein